MTRDRHFTPRSVARMRPSAASLASAAAVYDPGLLLRSQATHQGRAISSPTLLRGHGADVQPRSSGVATAARCRA